MKYIYILLFIILNLYSLSQEKTPDIQIIDDELTISARHTYFKNYLSEIFRPNRYIKIKVNGKIFDDSLNADNFKINIIDTSYNKINFKTLMRGQSKYAISGMKEGKEPKIKKPPNNKFRKRRDFYILRAPLRNFHDMGIGCTWNGYGLKKGVYFLNVEYYDEQKRIRHKSDDVKLIVK